MFGIQTTFAKTEFVLPAKNSSFSSDSYRNEQNQGFKPLEKEVQPNIGFLKEKSRFLFPQRPLIYSSVVPGKPQYGNILSALYDRVDGNENPSFAAVALLRYSMSA